MTTLRIMFPFLMCLASVSPCLGTDDATKSEIQIGPPEHFEMHAAWFLERMISANVSLSESESHAVALVFADYYRRTGEKLPRPVLIAYPIGEGTAMSTADASVISARATTHIQGEVQLKADGSRVMLVENLLGAFDKKHVEQFRVVLHRWAQIKPDPISIPIVQLMRAARDPLLKLTPQQHTKIQAILTDKSTNAMTIAASKTSSEMNPTIERIRREIALELSQKQQAQFEASFSFVEDEVVDWRALKTGGQVLYANAIVLLAEEAKKKKSSGE